MTAQLISRAGTLPRGADTHASGRVAVEQRCCHLAAADVVNEHEQHLWRVLDQARFSGAPVG